MKRLAIAVLAITLLLVGAPAGRLAAQPACPTEAPEPPWASLLAAGGLSQLVSAALPPFLEEAQPLVGGRYAGAWGILDDSGKERVEFAIVAPSAADRSMIQSLSDKFPDLAGKVDVIAGSMPETALMAKENQIESLLTSGAVEASSSTEVTSLSPRPDLGRVEVRTRNDTFSPLATAINSAFPGCVAVFSRDDVNNVTLVSRADMPPFKGGKIQQIPFPGEPKPATCSTGFVYALNGTAPTPLFMATAGHCSQADQNGQRVYAGNNLVTAVGQTLPPNLFRATSPAHGDAVFWGSIPPYSRSDFQNQIILNATDQRLVTSKLADASIVVGLSVCVSRTTSNDFACGAIDSPYQTVLRRVTYRDYLGHQYLEKDIDHEACANIAGLFGGDSGNPVFQLVSGNARAVGIVSTAVLGGGQPIRFCFTPVTYIGGQMGAHIWFG